MKNKIGFTLMEMIGVIVILGLLAAIIVPSLLNSVSNSKDEISTKNKVIIFSAADIYFEENNSSYLNSVYYVKLEVLVDEGKLVKPLKDYVTGNEIPLDYCVKGTVNEYDDLEYELVTSC